MAPPPVTIYVTSLTSQPKVRQHTELLHRSLKALEIPYESFDLVMDAEAKTRWQRAKPPGMVVGLPGFLVGGEWVGTMEDFEAAVEAQDLPTFLRQDVSIDPNLTASTSGVGQGELERLMREMNDEDLDKLASELGVTTGGVGLMVPPEAEGAEAEDIPEGEVEKSVQDTAEPDKLEGMSQAKSLEDRIKSLGLEQEIAPEKTEPVAVKEKADGKEKID